MGRKDNDTVNRRSQILTLLDKTGQVSISEMSKDFKVSEVTIRNDLEQMEAKNLLLRARGGAYKLEGSVRLDYSLAEKHKLNYSQKVAIGKQAALLIKPKETILIDSGTTTVEIVKHLPADLEITVITNALNIASLLINNENIETIIPGGQLRRKSLSLVGPLAQNNLHSFFVDKVFMGCDGLEVQNGFFTPNIDEAHVNQVMIKNAKEVILVADSSKFNKRSLNLVGQMTDIHILITDAGISNANKKKLEEIGIKVIVAN
jgi:DeoR family transcriptional regulator, aga operon transcriptional repressor